MDTINNGYLKKEKKMKSHRLLIILFILGVLILAACGGGETETPTATTLPSDTPEPVATEPVSDVTPVPVEEIQNIVWMWSALVETQPAAQSVVPNPQDYTLTLLPDNTFTAKADCNQVSGSFQADGSSLTLTLGPTTLAECGEDSLYDQYMALLGSVAAFGMRGELLIIGLQDDAGEMQYANGGPVVIEPTPTPHACDTGIDPSTVKIDTQDLYDSYLAECIIATPYDNSQPPGPTGLPDNIQVFFDLQNPQEYQPNDPIVYIIPVVEYVAMWEENGNDSVTRSIEALRELLEEKPEPIPTGLPILPYEQVGGTSDIQVQAEYLTIEMGEGVRFVTRFSQGPNPVTSDNPPLFYTFQGFSSDGVYLITFFHPVITESLPSADEVTEEEMNQMQADSQAYLDQKTAELNSLSSSDWEPDLATLDAMIISLKYGEEETAPAPTNPLTNIKWLWTSLVETDPASQSVIADSQNYNLAFFADGTVHYKADCNIGNGTYTISGSSMTIQLGQTTLVECGEGSLSTQFMSLLGQVAAYSFESENLILALKDNAGKMGFTNGGPVDSVTPPSSDTPTAVTIEPLNVRSGPGTEYYSYGVVPAGTEFVVTGISEDGQWWVVKVPTSIAPDGQGWINGNYVETSNTDNVPVVPTPPVVTPTPTTAATGSPTSEPGATETPQPGVTPSPTTAPSNPLAGTSWTLSTMNGQPPLDGTTITLAFSDSAVSGNGGCNTYGGSYAVDGNNISIGALTSTQVLCGTEIDQQEQQYFNLLGSANTYQLDSGQLVLFSGGSEVLRFN